ncbi:NFACT RNA binding domain-containing protein [Reichenbachiella ulvae]|uniref:NFACT RNA binding domain-containing protein n=1 Tax=Reichenbachiella ulvae TaxID=2980104 RepID=A0ABT3CQW8_9BACT|nr:NFACT RNA binding domain-containing protein [Reichenbachiella ulvae]MCV9386106.1 NFACT RNA binding domain-containing protein [Reichenbachiella ulvae]
MQFNYYFLRFLTQELTGHLVGKSLVNCFSQNKDELVLRFEDDGSFFLIKVNLDGEKSLLSFPEEFARAKRNSVDLFSELNHQIVHSIRQFKNERCFAIQFDHFDLLFKLHGRRANLILFKEGNYHSMFKTEMEQDQHLQLDHLDREIDQSSEALIESNFNLKKIYPTFDKTILSYLEESGFLDNDTEEEKQRLLDDTLRELKKPKFYLVENSFLPKISLLPPKDLEYVTEFESAILISNAFAKAFFTNYQFNKEKESELRKIEKEIKKANSYIQNTQNKIDEILSRRGFDEIANILMANLHEKVLPGQESIELLDFYQNKPITIKLKPNLNLQQNAEVLYRKSKNQGIELDKAEQNLNKKKDLLESLEMDLENVKSISEFKDLKQRLKTQNNQDKQMPPKAPFLSCEISGYTVWVGKNAKNNDLLTQKYARKDDLWLHAKDVSGSHTVIRNSSNQMIPKDVIEKAAELAAYYSKRKTDTLCPVIFTPKKYVRKPKGSLPGQVIVDREEVILVKPSQEALNSNQST